MNIVKLRRIIREKIEASLDGNEICESTETTYPQTFSEFRVWFGGLLEMVGTKSTLVESVSKGDCPSVPTYDTLLLTRMLNVWQDIKEDISMADDKGQIDELFSYYACELAQDIGLSESKIETLANILSENADTNGHEELKKATRRAWEGIQHDFQSEMGENDLEDAVQVVIDTIVNEQNPILRKLILPVAKRLRTYDKELVAIVKNELKKYF